MHLDKRRDKSDLLETFKIINRYYSINADLLLRIELFFEFDYGWQKSFQENIQNQKKKQVMQISF